MTDRCRQFLLFDYEHRLPRNLIRWELLLWVGRWVCVHVFSTMVKECAREIEICEEDMYTTRHNHVQFC